VTLRHTLTLHGFDVLLAADATEARAHFAQSSDIDLMLTDMILPGMSGSKLAREVLAKYPDLRVLFTSAYSRELLLQQRRITPRPTHTPEAVHGRGIGERTARLARTSAPSRG